MRGDAAGRPDVRRLVGRLVHDVGKYAARTAHNVAPGQWSPALSRMLTRDLFELAGGRASTVFAQLAAPLERELGARPELGRARALLDRIDGLEAAVRAGETAACASAAALALALEDDLRGLAASIAKEIS